MAQTAMKNARHLLQAAEYDLRAAKDLLRVTSQDQTDSMLCHVMHAVAKCQEAVELIAPEELKAQMREIEHLMDTLSHPAEDEHQERFAFDPVAITPTALRLERRAMTAKV